MSNPQQEGVDSSGVDKSGAPQLNPPADAVQCFVLDHSEDGPWAKALNALGEMGGRLGNLKIVGVSQGLDSPDRLLIPNDTKVIILHTRQNMIVWQKAFGTKYGIVRVSTTGNPSVPPESPIFIKGLTDILHTDFGPSASENQRTQARNALLKTVRDVYLALHPSPTT